MAMVADFVLEKTFEVLYAVVGDFICKNLMFQSISMKIKSQLCSLEPLIQEMAQYNQQLDLPKAELEAFEQLMKDGIELVHKCSKIVKFDVYKKFKYANKLKDLNDSLEEQFKILNVLIARDVRKNTVMLRDIGEAVSRLDCGKQNRSAEINAWCSVPELPSLTVGLDIPLKELKMKLLVEDNGVSMLVVTALGGCGKTTLATKFCQDPEVKEKFKENILFVTVARNPKLDLIVQKLYQHKGNYVPPFQNEVDTIRWLHEFLKNVGQNPFLLVLDDVWSGSEALLSKFDQVKISSYKILVTSRSEFSEIGSSYRLPLLDEAAAMELFNHSASLTDKSSHIPASLSVEVVKRCKGSPLAISVSGRSLCGKPLEMWQKRVIEWSKGFSILDSETELLFCLQSSLDTLDKNMSTAKECFLDLGSFPEDKKISVSILIDMWAELYELDEDALCIGYLYELCYRSLVNVVDKREDKMNEDGYYLEHFVTQHDLLRELAIYNSKLVNPVEHRERLIVDICGDYLPKWWREQNYQPMKARLLSVSTDEKFSMKWPNMLLPNAEVLVLNFQTKKYVLPEFVEKMDELKVLVVTNDRFVIVPAQLSNFELLGSLSKLKRMRLEGILVPSITTKSLQKISLFSCHISQAFSDSSAFPNLEELNIDRYLGEFPVEVFFFTHLKKLSITNCSRIGALPELGSLVNLEELRMRSCAKLSYLPNSIDRLNKLRKFDMSHCPRLNYLPESVKHLKQLEEVICDEGIKHLWKSFLPSLKSIQTMVSKMTQNDYSYRNWHRMYQG